MKSLVISGLIVLSLLLLLFFIGRVLLPCIRLQYFLIKYLKTRKIEELFQLLTILPDHDLLNVSETAKLPLFHEIDC